MHCIGARLLSTDLEVAECLGGRRGRAGELLGLLVIVVPRLVHLGARLRLHAGDAHGVVRRLEAAAANERMARRRKKAVKKSHSQNLFRNLTWDRGCTGPRSRGPLSTGSCSCDNCKRRKTVIDSYPRRPTPVLIFPHFGVSRGGPRPEEAYPQKYDPDDAREEPVRDEPRARIVQSCVGKVSSSNWQCPWLSGFCENMAQWILSTVAQ